MKKNTRVRVLGFILFVVCLVMLGGHPYFAEAGKPELTDAAWNEQYEQDMYLLGVETGCEDATAGFGHLITDQLDVPKEWRYYWVMVTNAQSAVFHQCQIKVLYEKFLKESDNPAM